MRTQQLHAVLIGCGGISNAWLKSVDKFSDVKLVGLVDVNRAAAESKAADYGLDVEIDTDLANMLRETKPDVLFDCASPEAHAAIDEIALAAGCHVLTEKPLATSLDAAGRVVRAAAANGRIHAVMQNRRYNDGLRKFRQVVQSGVIGTPTTLYADFFIGAHFGGFRESMPHVLLIDMAIHTFDAARYVTGSRPVSVSCHEWNPTGSWFDTGASAIAIFEMDDGSCFSYRGSWCSEGMPTSWESQWRAIGTVGSASWDGYENVAADIPEEGKSVVKSAREVGLPDNAALEYVGHAGCIREFLDAVHGRNTEESHIEPLTVSHDNIYSLAMSLCAAESAERREWVTIQM